MSANEKLIEDVKVALRTAGYGNVVSYASGPGVVVSADRGAAGAVFYVTPEMAGKAAAAPTLGGGRHADAGREDVAAVPSLPGIEALMVRDPALVATLFGVSTDMVQAVLRQTVR